MQRISFALILFVVFGVFSGTVSAAEFPHNPDQRPSLGVSMGYGAEFGDSTVTLTGASALQDLVVQAVELTVDARWSGPISWPRKRPHCHAAKTKSQEWPCDLARATTLGRSHEAGRTPEAT
jgi:hypothetical protein